MTALRVLVGAPRLDGGWSTQDPVWTAVLLVGICGLLYLLGASPALAWFVLVAVLCFATGDEILIRRMLAIAIVLSAAAVYSSRQTSGSWSDDLTNVYYPTYVAIRGGASALAPYVPSDTFAISSLEIALPTILLAFGVLPFTLSPAGLVFALTSLGGLLYYWWLEEYFLPDLPPSSRSSACALSLTLFSFGLCSQTARQMLGVPLLLAAIWEERPAKAWMLAGAASVWHLSALPIFGIWRFIAWRPRVAVIATASLVLLVRGESLAYALVGIDFGSIDKLLFYSEVNEEMVGFDQGYLPFIAGLCAMAWVARSYRNGSVTRLVVAFGMIFVALLPLPLASFRVTLFALAGLVGPMTALAVAPRVGEMTFSSVAFALSTVMLLRRVISTDASSGMALWHGFAFFDPIPFRYLVLLVSR